MHYQQLGKSTLQVSRIAFGCMSLGDHHLENARLLHEAVDLGINLFDTADLYQKGFNEETIGQAFKGRRSQIVIATKVGNQWRPDGSGWDWNPRKNYIKKAVKQSLRRLQTDYIDLYQLHGGTISDPSNETIEAFEELIEEGHIRYYGISSIRPNVIRRFVDQSSISSVMMQYSLLDRRPEEVCLGILKDADIGVLVRGALAKGLLANKPARDYLDHTTDFITSTQKTLEVMTNEHLTSAQIALLFVMAHPGISSLVCGIRTSEQLHEAIKSIDHDPLPPRLYHLLQEKVPAKQYKAHR